MFLMFLLISGDVAEIINIFFQILNTKINFNFAENEQIK